jgi:hypothetical protein
MVKQKDKQSISDELPEKVHTRLVDSEINTMARSNEKVTEVDIAYHLYAGDDSRLGLACTVSSVADEFDISEAAVRKRLDRLHSKGILQKKNRNGYLFRVEPELCKEIDAVDVPNVFEDQNDVATDGRGISRTDALPPNETAKTDNIPPQWNPTPNKSRVLDVLLDEMIVPIASVIGFLMTDFIAAGSASPLAAVLIIGVTWVLSKLAAVPNQLPWETHVRST